MVEPVRLQILALVLPATLVQLVEPVSFDSVKGRVLKLC